MMSGSFAPTSRASVKLDLKKFGGDLWRPPGAECRTQSLAVINECMWMIYVNDNMEGKG